ncbi:MAG: ABC transporter ATP-binding protein [Phycisphaerales bacterium]|jgi:ABC-2 type transport system ATP-binding protein|nr:ABC transporter ATP-binding protein [Phycisphaerales bacterium]
MILQTTKLTRRFGNILALRDVDLCVEVGQIRGLLGPNGAGKSTAIRMICGVLTPTDGSVHIHDVDLLSDPVRAKSHIGYLPEGAPLPNELRGIDYLSYVGRLQGLGKQGTVSAIDRWSTRCDVQHVLHQPIGTLSRGYRQRVALAGALLHAPKLLVLDEPSTGLDPEQNVLFRNLVKELSASSGVLYSSHNLSEVESTCDVVSVLSNGGIVADGTFESLSTGRETVSLEVSPHNILEELPVIRCTKIDDTWMHCICEDQQVSVTELCERVAQIVSENGGMLRLLQPTKENSEATYLRLIQDSQVGL